MQRIWVISWVEIALVLVWGTAVVVALCWRGWLSRRVALGALLALVLCDQLLFAVPYVPQPAARLAYPETATQTRLQHTVGSARMAAAGTIVPPDSNLPYHLHDLRAYDPTASSRYMRYMVALAPTLNQDLRVCCQVLVCPSLTLLSVASVAYYATLPDEDANACRLRQSGQPEAAGPFVPLWTQGV